MEHGLDSTVHTLHRWVHRGVITGSYTIHGSMESAIKCMIFATLHLRRSANATKFHTSNHAPKCTYNTIHAFFTATVSFVRRSYQLFIGYNWNDMLEWYFIFWIHLDSVARATIHSSGQLRRNNCGVKNLFEPPHGFGVREKYDEGTDRGESMSLVVHSLVHNVHNLNWRDGSVRTHGHITHETAMKAIRNYYSGKRKIYICISKTDYK